jgi:predicted AlkP superfamily phosphohydrolase/phosphomutase
VGYPSLHLLENDTGPDDCNHAQHGAFLLAAPGCPLSGPLEGAHLLDIAPTLLELGGYETPSTMQGRSLLASQPLQPPGSTPAETDEIRSRLSGLGYIS